MSFYLLLARIDQYGRPKELSQRVEGDKGLTEALRRFYHVTTEEVEKHPEDQKMPKQKLMKEQAEKQQTEEAKEKEEITPEEQEQQEQDEESDLEIDEVPVQLFC